MCIVWGFISISLSRGIRLVYSYRVCILIWQIGSRAKEASASIYSNDRVTYCSRDTDYYCDHWKDVIALHAWKISLYKIDVSLPKVFFFFFLPENAVFFFSLLSFLRETVEVQNRSREKYSGDCCFRTITSTIGHRITFRLIFFIWLLTLYNACITHIVCVHIVCCVMNDLFRIIISFQIFNWN